MSGHGAHFDDFRSQSGSPHGGAEFDAGFGLQATLDPQKHGERFDEFAKRPGVDKHGERWDEFGWKDMPVHHGSRFDEAFASHTALANEAGHGTWFDAFRGGTQLRYLADGGAEYEGTVINLEADHAVVESRDGRRQEVALGQILQWRDGTAATDLGPNRREADRPDAGMPMDAARGGAIASLNTDSIPRSDAEAPSAHSHEAAGGGERQQINPQMERPFITLKTVGEVYDVGKLQVTGKVMANAVEQHRSNVAHIANGEANKVKCPSCGEGSSYDVGHTPARGAKMGSSKMFGSCRGCGFKHTFPAPKIKSTPRPSKLAKTDADELDVEKLGSKGGAFSVSGQSGHYCGTCAKRVGGTATPAKIDGTKPCASCKGPISTHAGAVAKSVDSSETAVQGDTDGGGGGGGEGKAWCSNCQHYCRKVQGGKCPTCGHKVTVKKTAERFVDIVKSLAERAGVTR